MSSRWTAFARRFIRRSGFDVVRFPDSDPAQAIAPLLTRCSVDVVLDVGGNNGGYGRLLRQSGYNGRIVSLEPGAAAFARLEEAAALDDRWSVERLALGAEDGEMTLHIAGNDGESSSVLPMLDEHRASSPSSAYVGDETVRMARLDTVFDDLVGVGRAPFLKLDVQGYELRVLEGAERSLDRCQGVQVEISLVPLYEQGADYLAVLGHLAEHGFVPEQIVPGFREPTTRRLLQADIVMMRPG